MVSIPLRPIEKLSLVLNLERVLILRMSYEDLVLLFEERGIDKQPYIDDIKAVTNSESPCY